MLSDCPYRQQFLPFDYSNLVTNMERVHDRRQVLLLLLLLVTYIRHIQRVRLRLQEEREEKQRSYTLQRQPISYEARVFRLDNCGWDEVDFREYLRYCCFPSPSPPPEAGTFSSSLSS